MAHPPQSLESLLAQMVSFDTVTTPFSGKPRAEAALAQHLAELAQGWGLTTRFLEVGEPFARNLLVTHEAGPDRPWWLLVSHLDTVSVEGMSIDPFAGRIEGDRLYGRGACDTKGSGAAMLWALKTCVQRQGSANNVAILFSINEEAGMHGVRAFLEHDLDTLGWRPRGVVVGEPTRLRPVVAHNGSMMVRITTHGVAAHASTPGQGRSAVSLMLRVLAAVERDYQPTLTASHELTGPPQVTITMLQGGAGRNIVPARCEATLDRRVTPREDPETVVPALRRVVEAAADELRGHVEVEQVGLTPSLICTNRDFSDLVGRHLREMGLEGEPAGAPYCTEAGQLAAAGLDVLVLGPGDAAQAHVKDEWVDLEQVRQAATLYGRLMAEPAS